MEKNSQQLSKSSILSVSCQTEKPKTCISVFSHFSKHVQLKEDWNYCQIYLGFCKQCTERIHMKVAELFQFASMGCLRLSWSRFSLSMLINAVPLVI